MRTGTLLSCAMLFGSLLSASLLPACGSEGGASPESWRANGAMSPEYAPVHVLTPPTVTCLSNPYCSSNPGLSFGANVPGWVMVATVPGKNWYGWAWDPTFSDRLRAAGCIPGNYYFPAGNFIEEDGGIGGAVVPQADDTMWATAFCPPGVGIPEPGGLMEPDGGINPNGFTFPGGGPNDGKDNAGVVTCDSCTGTPPVVKVGEIYQIWEVVAWEVTQPEGWDGQFPGGCGQINCTCNAVDCLQVGALLPVDTSGGAALQE
jgi:hypothetical protein